MPEQFSEEYVAEVRKYPWLQEMWQPEPPDLFWIDGNIFVITFVSELGDVDAKCIHGPVIGLAHYRSDSQFFQARQRGDILWLPTLGELVEMLAQARIGFGLYGPLVHDAGYEAGAVTTDAQFREPDAKVALVNLLAAVREETEDA